MKRLLTFAAALLLGFGLLGPGTANAQTSVQLGPRLGIPVGDLEDATSLYIGADVRIHSENLPVVPNASFDYYFTDVDELSIFTVDLNALYEFGVDNEAFTPYAGGGLAITRTSFDAASGGFAISSDDTEVGLNLVGGARFPLGNIEPFAQLNATLGGDLQRLGVTGGLLFNL
jgi:hypothetical protein